MWHYLKWLMIHLLKWPVIGSQCRLQPLWVRDCCLAVWWPWERSCFSISRSEFCTCTDLAFWMVAGWTGSGLGGCCPWWPFWPSCDICRCPGGQVVCPRWCVMLTRPPSGEPYTYGRCSCRCEEEEPSDVFVTCQDGCRTLKSTSGTTNEIPIW